MGYRRQLKLIKLTFEDEPGLEVMVESVSLGRILDLMGMTEDKEALKTRVGILGIFEPFAEKLHSWNLEDENGVPVPATLEGMLTQDVDFILGLIMDWMDVLVSVSGPLNPRSSSGNQSLEESVPMAALSGNLNN